MKGKIFYLFIPIWFHLCIVILQYIHKNLKLPIDLHGTS
jgi:hypothetical protein